VLAGYFLKLRRDERRGPDHQAGSTHVVVPVLVGRAVLVEQRSLPAPGPTGVASVALVGSVVVLAGLWVALRMQVRRRRRSRQQDAGRRQGPTDPTDPDAPEHQPVDLDALQRGESTINAVRADEDSDVPAKGHRSCPTCGADNREAARFCDQCAAPLAQERPSKGER
jgi:hypothetical protein